jgi:hypothetical protein
MAKLHQSITQMRAKKTGSACYESMCHVCEHPQYMTASRRIAQGHYQMLLNAPGLRRSVVYCRLSEFAN